MEHSRSSLKNNADEQGATLVELAVAICAAVLILLMATPNIELAGMKRIDEGTDLWRDYHFELNEGSNGINDSD